MEQPNEIMRRVRMELTAAQVHMLQMLGVPESECMAMATEAVEALGQQAIERANKRTSESLFRVLPASLWVKLCSGNGQELQFSGEEQDARAIVREVAEAARRRLQGLDHAVKDWITLLKPSAGPLLIGWRNHVRIRGK